MINPTFEQYCDKEFLNKSGLIIIAISCNPQYNFEHFSNAEVLHGSDLVVLSHFISVLYVGTTWCTPLTYSCKHVPSCKHAICQSQVPLHLHISDFKTKKNLTVYHLAI